MIFYFLTQNAHADGAKAAGGKTPPARRRSAFEKADFFRSEKCLAAGKRAGQCLRLQGSKAELFRKEFSPVRKRESGAVSAPLSLFLLRQGRKKRRGIAAPFSSSEWIILLFPLFWLSSFWAFLPRRALLRQQLLP